MSYHRLKFRHCLHRQLSFWQLLEQWQKFRQNDNFSVSVFLVSWHYCLWYIWPNMITGQCANGTKLRIRCHYENVFEDFFRQYLIVKRALMKVMQLSNPTSNLNKYISIYCIGRGSHCSYTLITDAWWRHEMETFSALLAICAGNSPVPGEFPTQRPVTRSFDVFFDLRLNKRLSKQSWGWWLVTPSRPLWRHRNG